MLETRVIVMETAPNIAWVQALQTSSCDQCNGKGCGSSKLGQLFCNKPRQFQVDNPIGAEVGDEVVVAVIEGMVLRGIGIVYVMPLLLMLVGAGLAQQVNPADLSAALGAAIGLIIGFGLAKWLSSRPRTSQTTPYIIRKI